MILNGPVSQIVTFTFLGRPSGPAASITFTLKSTPEALLDDKIIDYPKSKILTLTNCTLQIVVEVAICKL